MIIQENLKWNRHIDTVCGKLAGITSAIKRFGNKLLPNVKITLYYSMFNSFITYLIPIWSSSISQNEKDKLQVAQNHAIRTIFVYEYNTLKLHTHEIRKKYKILDIEQLIYYNQMIMMFKIDKKLMKSNHTIDRNPTHSYTTRHSALPRLIPFRTNMGKNSVFRACTEGYRSLDPSLIEQSTVLSFKKRLKEKIINTI